MKTKQLDPADLEAAVAVIENCAGFTDETTSVGEAWAVIKRYLPHYDWRRNAIRHCLDDEGML